MSNLVDFDSSLPMFANLVFEEWGDIALRENLFLRDVTGKLTFVVVNGKHKSAERIALSKKAFSKLGSYVDSDNFSVMTAEELFDDRLSKLDGSIKINIKTNKVDSFVNLVDRRMVGADWLRTPAPSAKPPQRLVFSSIKGGVGRSTSLCILAEHLASKGRRVLAIDMDIEAPGLGNMLLPEDTLPNYGLLDYLVEQSFGELDDQFYVDMIGSSWLGGGRGRVDVLPAIGKRSLENSSNVLAKIARAYLPSGENSNPDLADEIPSFMDHMRFLVDRLADPLRYDAILIDARAGLHETTAAAVVGLGATVLFFGIDQPQTFAGYQLLLAHLGTLPVDLQDDWRDRICFIQAKAPASVEKRQNFSSKVGELFQNFIWPEQKNEDKKINVALLKDTFEVEWDESILKTPELDIDSENSLPVISVLDDDRYHSFDPLEDRDILLENIYKETFGEFLKFSEQVFEKIEVKE